MSSTNTRVLSKKLSPLQHAILAVKLRVSTKAKLNDTESQLVISKWKDKSEESENTAYKLEVVADKTEAYTKRLEKGIDQANIDMLESAKALKKSKTDADKKKHARKLVIASDCKVQLESSKKRLETTVVRVREAVEDAQIAKVMLDARIAEADIYRQINGGLKLIDLSLAEARREHIGAKEEQRNVDVTLGELDKRISTRDAESIMKQAEKLLSQMDKKNALK